MHPIIHAYESVSSSPNPPPQLRLQPAALPPMSLRKQTPARVCTIRIVQLPDYMGRNWSLKTKKKNKKNLVRFNSIPVVPYVVGLLWRVKAFLTLLNRRPVRGREQLLKSGINLSVLRIQLLPSPDTFNFWRNTDGRSWSVLCPALWVEVAGIGFRFLFPHQQVVCDLSHFSPPILLHS